MQDKGGHNMKKNKQPIEWAKSMIDAVMDKYRPEELPPKGSFFYHQGVFLSGIQKVYNYTKDIKYFEYVKEYIDSVIDDNGIIAGYSVDRLSPEKSWFFNTTLTTLDNKQPAILLFDLYNETKKEKYKKALDCVIESMHYWPANPYGGYWHMMNQTDQMWLDGAYMIGPLCCMYDHCYGDEILKNNAVKQILLMNEHMKDPKTGLYYHAWDASKNAKWADKETGVSSQFWGRAIGWYAVAILDIIDNIDDSHISELTAIETDLLKSLALYQDDKTGMWYQIVDKVGCEDNWIEASASCLFTYAYARAIKNGILDLKKYLPLLIKAYEGIISSLEFDEKGKTILGNICAGTCVEEGTYDYYVKRPSTKNDLHGTGAFVLMCEAVQECYDYFNLK